MYNNTEVCKNCSNNPANNPHASGICHCALPHLTPPTALPVSIPTVWIMDGRIQPDTITTTNVNTDKWSIWPLDGGMGD